MKQIVVATDLSERSDRAVERALMLAGQHDAACTVVSIVDDALPSELASEVKAGAERQLRAFLDAHDGGSAEIDVQVGDIVAGVLGMAHERDADLLVLGLHRRREFMDAIRETTMERIVALSQQPVLLVHDPANAPYSSVLVAVGFSDACAAAAAAARRLAPDATQSVFHALHVPFAGLTGGRGSDMEKAVRREAEGLARAWQSRHSVPDDMPEIITGSVYQILDQKLRAEKPDLLAIGAHTRSGLGFHRLGAFASGLIRTPPTDLLVARC